MNLPRISLTICFLAVACLFLVALPQVSAGFHDWILGADAGDRLVALVGLVGALVTALTIVATAYLALKRLSHERDENLKNRNLELKKEVLLDAVRGLGGQIAAVGMLGVVETPIEEARDKFQESSEKISAAYAVASPEVVRLMRASTTKAGRSLMELLEERSRIQNIHTDMRIASEQQTKASDRAQRLTEQHASAMVRGADGREMDALEKLVQFNLQQSQSYSDERDEAYCSLVKARVPFMHAVTGKVVECEGALKMAVAAIRIDMSIDESSDAYLQAAELDLRDLKEAIDSVGASVGDQRKNGKTE